MYLQLLWPNGDGYEELEFSELRLAIAAGCRSLNLASCEVTRARVLDEHGVELWSAVKVPGIALRASDAPPLVDAENYADYAEALHAWLSLNHGGSHSLEYILLSSSLFGPGPMWSESRVKWENPYYSEVNRENCVELMTEVNYFIEKARDE